MTLQPPPYTPPFARGSNLSSPPTLSRRKAGARETPLERELSTRGPASRAAQSWATGSRPPQPGRAGQSIAHGRARGEGGLRRRAPYQFADLTLRGEAQGRGACSTSKLMASCPWNDRNFFVTVVRCSPFQVICSGWIISISPVRERGGNGCQPLPCGCPRFGTWNTG